MDNTKEIFKQYFTLTAAIERHIANGSYREIYSYTNDEGKELVYRPEEILSPLAEKTMREAIENNGYSLTLDDVCKCLDLEDRYVRNNILPKLDYFNAPQYAGNYFISNLRYTFWQQRYYKWKKTFINLDSFINYLQEHLVIGYEEQYPKAYGVNDSMNIVKVNHQIKVDANIARSIIECKELRLIKKSNLKHIVVKEKLEKFKHKTLTEIKLFEQSIRGTISESEYQDRLKEEKSLVQRLKADDLNIKAYEKEIQDYLDLNAHQRFELYVEGMLKPTVLYWFLGKVSTDY